MLKLQEVIKKIQQNKRLVVLRSCESGFQERLLGELTAGYRVVDLSLPKLRLQAEQNPDIFLQELFVNSGEVLSAQKQLSSSTVIDNKLMQGIYFANLEYVPRLVKAIMEWQGKPVQVLASCSQSYFLEEQAGDEVSFVELPLDGEEKVSLTAMMENTQSAQSKDVYRQILQGSMAQDAELYVQRVLRRDILERTTVSDEIKYYRFLSMVANMLGKIVNYSALANGVGITAPTAKLWLQYLVGTGMVYLLHAVCDLPGKRLIKAPKLYFKDTGMACSLLQLADTPKLVASVYAKSLLENYVVSYIRESYLAKGQEPPLCFYKDSNNKEISLVAQEGSSLYAFMIAADLIKPNKLEKSFAIIKEYAEYKNLAYQEGCLLTLGGSTQRLDEQLWQQNIALL